MKKILLAIVSVSLFITLFAQKKFEGISVNPEASRTAKQAFSKYGLFNFNLPEIRRYLQSVESSTKTIELALPGYESFVLELEKNDILSANYSATVAGEKEKINYGRPERVLTFIGRVKGETSGRRTVLTITDNLVFGYIRKGGKEYFIETLKGIDPGTSGNTSVIYETKDVMVRGEFTCGATEVTERNETISNREVSKGTATGACKMVELAIASDYSMFQKYYDANTLLEHNIAVVNTMVGIYSDAQFINPSSYLEFKIVKQYISSSALADPLLPAYNRLDRDTLLNYFTAWGQVPSHFGVHFDIGQMWTTRNIDTSGVIGYASPSSICGSNAFQVLEDYISLSGDQKGALAAHETGHNLGASHDPSGTNYLMSPSVGNPPNTTFSTTSINAISTKLASVSCLSACNLQAPVAQFSVPVSMCLGNAVQFTDASVGQVINRTWSFPGGSPLSSSSASAAVTYATPGTKSVTLNVSSASGISSITKSFLVSNPPATLANSCKTTVQSTGTSNQPVFYAFGFGNISSNLGAYRAYGNYYDFTCTNNTLVKAGATYMASAEIGYLPFGGGSKYDTKLDVFLDLNNDADFADVGEKIYASATCTQGTISFPLTFPANPPIYNQLLRLRLIAHTCASTITNGCNIPPNSVVVDYSVAILPSLGPILYVDNSRAESGDGSSWSASINQLSEALSMANQYPSVSEIRVAKGTYNPTNDTNRDSTFALLRGGLKLYGGYPSGGGIRNAAINPTILSGDIGTANDSTDNSYHVMVIAGIAPNADSLVLDGFTIVRGTASGSSLTKIYGGIELPGDRGGGLAVVSSDSAVNRIAIRNCIFRNNYGGTGGGIYTDFSSPTISDCLFEMNKASGGGMRINNSSPILTNCVFSSSISNVGGGLYLTYSSPRLTGCRFNDNGNDNATGGGVYVLESAPYFSDCGFYRNKGGSGGALYGDNSPTTFMHCTFDSNVAGLMGGAITLRSFTAINCSFTNNYSGLKGGAISTSGRSTLSNCLFYGNSTQGSGGAIYNEGRSNFYITNCTLVANYVSVSSNGNLTGQGGAIFGDTAIVTNSIIWNNTAFSGPGIFGKSMVSYSIVQDGNPGTGNLNTDPRFINASDVNGPDSIPGTADDGLRLNCTSPAINKGNNNAITGIQTDIAGTARIQQSVVDMGAYESMYTMPVAPLVSISANPGKTVCKGTSVIFTATPVNGGTAPLYQWKKNRQNVGSNSDTFTTSDLANGDTITVVFTSSLICGYSATATDTLIVIVNALPAKPVITASGPITFCVGDSVVLSAPAGFAAYSWSNNATTQSITITQSGAYSVKVTNGSGCTSPASDQTLVNVGALPATPTVTVTQPTCSISTGTITVNTPTGAAYSINGTDYQISNVFNNLAPNNYSVTAKNSSSCNSVATPVTINVQPATLSKPVITASGPITFCAGGSVVLSAPSGFTSYLWSNNATTQSITVNQSGSYSVKVTNGSGCTSPSSDATTVTVKALPATPTVSVTQPTCTVATGTITVNIPTGTDLTYSINGSTYQTSSTFNNVAPSNYNVTAKNSSGCVSAATPVTINPQPATLSKPVITASGPTTFCAGSSVILSAPASTSYLWSNNATTQSITVTQSGAYSVKVTNGSGCTSPTSDVTTVTVNPLPAPPAISNATAYQGTAPVILTAANCSGTLVWTNPNGTTGSGSQISVPTTTPGSYTYQVACKGTSCTSTYTPVTVTILSTLISVSHLDGDNNQPVNNIIKPYLQLNNESNTAIPYRDLSVRYWLTAENYAPFTNLSVYYAQLGSSSVSMKYVKTTARQGAFGYIEYTFNAAAGNLPANTNSGPIQTGVGKQDWSMFNEADDYSFAPNTAYTKTGKITIYRNGSLIWGTEPSPVAPVTSLATYAQNQNSATNTNTISTYLKVNNEGNQPVAYKDITVRYWFTTDGSSPLNYTLDYAQLGSNNVTGSFIKLPTALPKADTYLQLSFPNLTDSLYPISSTGNIQQRINKQDWSAFNETNDHSYKAAGPMAQNATITIYIKGQLVFGTEPTAQSMARSSTESTTQPAMVSAVKGTTETAAKELSVKVLQNPLEGNELQFIITGAKGQSLKVQLVDATGRLMTEKEIRNAGATEFQQLPVADNASQLIYLRVSMGNVFKVVKVVKAHASVNK